MTPLFPPRLRVPIVPTVAAILLMSTVPAIARAEPFRISIDEGTVNVVVDAAAMAKPYELSHMPQGHCLPEVEIVSVPDGVQVQHTRNCHGSGRNEGTVFTLKLSAMQDYDLRLKSGRVNITDNWGEGGFKAFDGRVSVGGINNRRPELDVTIERRRLLGASAHLGRTDAGDGGLKTTVTYGEINLL